MPVDGPGTLVALIRHGDYHQLPGVPSAHQPFPLNPEGEAQARRAVTLVRGLLERHGWHLRQPLHSSNMLRAWQTARILAEGLTDLFGAVPAIDSFDALAERGLGCAANLTLEEIERILQQDPRFDLPPPGWKADSHYRLPLQGAESLLQAGERVAAHLRRVTAATGDDGAAPGRLLLCVGHGAAFRHAAYHLGVLTFGDIARLSMYHASPVVLECRADGSWRHVAGEWKVREDNAGDLD